MKRFYLIILFVFFQFVCLAQEQLGYVKTISRSQRPGQYLGNVVLNIGNQRNRILSDSITGEFKLKLSSDEVINGFSLKSVTKRGYALQNREDLRLYPYSPNIKLPIYMYSISERMQEEELIKERSLAEMRKKYNQLIDDLKRKEADVSILNSKLSELEDRFNNCELLINELASVYASVNYENLSPTDSLINVYIEHGEIEAADSLVNLKDDLENRYKQAIVMQQASTSLSILSQNLTDEVVNDYWIKYYVSFINFKFDECSLYLERIANLKSNSFDVQKTISNFYVMLGDYPNALSHLSMAFEIADKANDRYLKASALSLMAVYNLYNGLSNLASSNLLDALKLYDIDLSFILDHLDSYSITTSTKEIDEYVLYFNEKGLRIEDVSIILNIISQYSVIESTLGNINRSLLVSLFSLEFVTAGIDKLYLLDTIINISTSYSNSGLFPIAEQFLELVYPEVKDLQEYRYVSTLIELLLINTKFRINGKELEVKQLADRTIESVNVIGEDKLNPLLLVTFYISVSNAYQSNSFIDKSLDYLLKAEQVYTDSNLNRPDVLASILNNTGQLFFKQKEFSSAISYFEKALGLCPNNESLMSMLYFNLGQNYRHLGGQNYLHIALDYLNKSLNIREKSYTKENIPSYYLFESYNNLASLYYEIGQRLEAFDYYYKAYEVSKELFGKNKYETLCALTNAYQVLYRERYLYENDTILSKYQEFLSNVFFIISPKRKDASDFYYLISIDECDDFYDINPITKIKNNKSCQIKYQINDEIKILNNEDIDQYQVFVIEKE